VAANKETTLK